MLFWQRPHFTKTVTFNSKNSLENEKITKFYIMPKPWERNGTFTSKPTWLLKGRKSNNLNYNKHFLTFIVIFQKIIFIILAHAHIC